MVKLKTRQLKAFTLIETLVSLILVTVVFGISLLVFNQVAADDFAQQKAAFISDEYFSKIEGGSLSPNKASYTKEEYSILVNSFNYQDTKHLYQVNIEVEKNKKSIYSSSRLIIIHED